MRKILSLLLCVHFILLTSACLAQFATDKKRPTSITLSAGATYNRVGGSKYDRWKDLARSLYGNPDVVQGKNIGFAVTLNLQKQISRLWYIKSGLGYIEKKVQVGIGDPELPGNDKVSINYVSVPLLIGMNMKPEASAFNVWMELGPNLGFAVGNKSDQYMWMPKTMTPVISIDAGTGIKFALSPTLNSLLSYNFIYDLSNAKEYPAPSIILSKSHYKFRSHVVSLGLQMIVPERRHHTFIDR